MPDGLEFDVAHAFNSTAEAGKIGKHATGRLGLYWGKTPDKLRQAKSVPEAITLSWLELFQEMTPQILGLRLTEEKP